MVDKFNKNDSVLCNKRCKHGYNLQKLLETHKEYIIEQRYKENEEEALLDENSYTSQFNRLFVKGNKYFTDNLYNEEMDHYITLLGQVCLNHINEEVLEKIYQIINIFLNP